MRKHLLNTLGAVALMGLIGYPMNAIIFIADQGIGLLGKIRRRWNG